MQLSNLGPHVDKVSLWLQIAPFVLLNLLMPAFMHSLTGYYDKRWAPVLHVFVYFVFQECYCVGID